MTAPIYTAATRGGKDRDTAAVCAVLERLAGHRRKFKVKSWKVESKRDKWISGEVEESEKCNG